MNSAPFEDPRAKVLNARGHIELVEKRFAEYLSGKPSFRFESGAVQTLNFGSGEPLPKTIALAAGDAIHNLRSALDIMAGDVVQASGNGRKGVSFPFAGNAAGLDKQIRDKQFDKAAPEAVELLRSFAPYKGGNAALRAIHDLDVTDKHQFLIPTGQRHTVSMRIGGLTLNNVSFSGNANDIVVAGSPPFALPSSQDVSTKLIFAPGKPLAGEEAIPTLERLADLTDTVIEAFAALFTSEGNPAPGKPAA